MRKSHIWFRVGVVLFLVAGCSGKGKEKDLYPGIVTATNGLVLRTGPAVTNAKILGMPYGTRVSVIATNGPVALIGGEYDNWYRLRIGTNRGWAFGGFVNRLGTNYSQVMVQMKKNALNLETESWHAYISTDKGYFAAEPPDVEFLDKQKRSFFYRKLQEFFYNAVISGGQSLLQVKLFITEGRGIAGGVLAGSGPILLDYYHHKTKRIMAADVATIGLLLRNYQNSGYYRCLVGDKGYFGHGYDKRLNEYWSAVWDSIKQNGVYGERFFTITNAGQYTVGYLPAGKLGKYGFGINAGGHVSAEVGNEPYLGIPLWIVKSSLPRK